MAEEISWEIREDAYNLYVTDGLTYEQVAKRTGVSLSQVKRWGQAENWADAKREYRHALQSIKRDTVKLRASLLKNALSSKDPQDVYAFAALERIEAARKTGTLPTPPAPERLKEIKTPQDAVDALQDVMEMKLNRLLASPDEVKLSDVNEVKKSLELVEQMRVKQSRTDDGKKARGFDADQLARIQNMLEGEV